MLGTRCGVEDITPVRYPSNFSVPPPGGDCIWQQKIEFVKVGKQKIPATNPGSSPTNILNNPCKRHPEPYCGKAYLPKR